MSNYLTGRDIKALVSEIPDDAEIELYGLGDEDAYSTSNLAVLGIWQEYRPGVYLLAGADSDESIEREKRDNYLTVLRQISGTGVR